MVTEHQLQKDGEGECFCAQMKVWDSPWLLGTDTLFSPPFPFFSNSTRPSAQHMELIVQNLVSWLILSVALSDVL